MREFTVPAVALSLTLALAASVTFPAGASAAENNSEFPGSQEARCIDVTDDPAGCQPSTFEVPIGQMPSTRLGRNGQADSFSSDEEAVAGAFHLEKKLRLFRNFEHLHWVPLIPSVIDPVTGEKSRGDLDGSGDARGLGVSGNCIFAGHSNGGNNQRDINVVRIQPDPEKNRPVIVGSIPAFIISNDAFDDREIRAIQYGGGRMLMIRNATSRQQGKLETFAIDPATCMPTFKSNTFDFGGQSHEFYLWQDPANANRILIAVAMFSGAGRPDPNNLGGSVPDLQVLAVTNENTGEVLADAQILAGFSLQEIGGPVLNETPDVNGLFADGRFPNFDELTDSFGRPGADQTSQRNALHSAAMSNDGERIYVAGTTAGFYILNSSAVANSTNADLIAGAAGCNKRSTNVWVGGIIGGDIDATALADVANDCIHMVVHDDPGVQALSAAGEVEKVLKLMDRSRFDPYPPVMTFTGFHSAVPVPNRPSLTNGNVDGRPQLVIVTDEKPQTECPTTWLRIMNTDSEISPTQHGSFGVPINQMVNCLEQSATEPNGDPRRRRSMQSHNPTAFKNLVFISWYGQGIRAIDISIPQSPREVGYAITAPHGRARTYPVFKDGLMYWLDNNTGLHVARYFGPRADELPGPGTGVTEGNATSPHQ